MKRACFAWILTLLVAIPASAVTTIVRPQTGCTGTSQTFQFTATVTGTSDTRVKWYVDGTAGGSSAAGTISSSGLYTAPSGAGTHTVTAVSVVKTTSHFNATIRVISGIEVTMAFGTAAVLSDNTQQFSAAVCGSANKTVYWSSTGGLISSTGLYTAPAVAGTNQVTATSAADPSKTAKSTVSVFSQVAADFGSRTGGKAVPANLFAAQYVERLPASVAGMFRDAGFTGGRTMARMSDVYATTTPNWTVIDRIISKYFDAGIAPIVEIAYAPPWLLPPRPCSAAGAPIDINRWAQLAATYVAHFDQKYPGFISEYEIWNEPSYNLCGVADKLQTYLTMYAAAGRAMRAQANADGRTIRIGGPVSFGQVNWINALLTNPSTAPYVDFISYHRYGIGWNEIQLGLNWDSSTDTRHLYGRTQDPVTGMAAVYKKVLDAAKNAVPVYLTEYNDSAAFTVDCCRNNPTYGPLWNALVVADLLNATYSGAQAVPTRLVYYAAAGGTVNVGYFCLYGTYNSKMDCATSDGYQPYPQAYAYTLMASPVYLGLKNGGHMAISVSPPTTAMGLAATAFYTGTKDAVMIVNPTSKNYSELRVFLQNPGISASMGTYYLLNAANPNIAMEPLSLTPVTGGYSAAIALPAYSVAAISITGP
jgi:hypothetical protein